MDKLERKLRFLSRYNIIYVLIGCYALGYILEMVAPSLLLYLEFDPALILKGQVWRLVTFIVHSGASNFFMALIMCFIYISISKSLEQIIGTFRLNFFFIAGLLIEVIFGFIFYAVFPVPTCYYVSYLNPYYLYAMLFVLFALLFPEAQFLFMFIFPVKGRWMIFITLALYVLEIASAFFNGFPGYAWILVFMILASVLNLILFLWLCNYSFARKSDTVINFRKARREASRSATFGSSSQKMRAEVPRHKCEICGRTNQTNPELDFRYCSKCFGNHEYCTDHLYTHIHVKDPQDIVDNFSNNGNA